jgi:ABC-type Mn2+/Zn2+ transport system permease subunit
VLDPFQFPFMQRALLEVLLLAPIAGLLGTQIVLRRLAFFTHGVGVAAFPGLVVAGPAGVPPALAAVGVGGVFAGLLELLSRRARFSYDAATALLLVLALAIGIVLASDVFESGSGVDQLLFGSLLAIGDRELLGTAIGLLLALLAVAVGRRSWIAAGFEPESSRSLGLKITSADRLLLAAVAVAAIATLAAAGALLVCAVLVIPAATVRLLAPNVVSLELGTVLLAAVEGVAGLLIAYHLDVPPGAAISVLGGILFTFVLLGRLGASRGTRIPEFRLGPLRRPG